MRGPPRPDSSCKDSVKRGARLLSPKGEAATLWWRDRRAKTPAHPHRTRPRPACARSGPGGDDRLARCPACRTAHDGFRERPFPLRSRRAALARPGHGAVPDALDGGPLERLGGRGAGGRGQAGCGHRRAGPCERLAARQPVVGRALRPDRVPAAREGQPPAGLVRLEPRGRRPRADAAEGRCAGDRAARRLEGGREDPARGTLVRGQPAARDRPPHRGRERVHRGPGARDREGDPALPREGERLERHRLQLPRRPLRHRLRGPLRRDREERRRSARGGVQHRLGRCRGDRRVQLARGGGEGAELAGGAARLAARHRARRSGLDAVLHLGRQCALRRRAPRLPPHRLGASRHRVHRLSGDGALQPAQQHRRRGLADRAAEAVRTDRQRHRPRHGALPGEALVAAALGRRRLRRRRERGGVLERHRRQRRLDLGRDGGGAGELHVLDPLGPERHACRGRHRRR